MLPELLKIISQSDKRILFVGIGNVLKNDDGVGVYITNRVKNSKIVLSLTVEVSIENYIGKINSMKPDILVLVDCAEMKSPPGTCRLFKPEQIFDITFSTHNISLKKIADFFSMEVFILGIQPENIEFGENISYLVKQVADQIIQMINSQEVKMATEFLCKICRGVLNGKTSIILAAQKLNSSKRGLVYLNPELGNYTSATHPSFKLNEGEEYIYTCPICHAQLNSTKYDHLVRILMIDDDGKEYNIYFSDIAGEKCTFKIRGDKVEETKGPDVQIYNKYFDIPEEDRKYL